MPLPPAFQRLALSNLAAQSAEQMAQAASPLIAVLALGAGAAETGLLSAAQALPFLLLSLPAGVLADRMRRRRLMAGAELLRAVSLLTLPVLLWLDLLSLPLLAVIGALTATGTVVYSVGAPALVPGLVERSEFGAANTRLELARSLAFTAGPSLAGIVVAWLGGGTAFIIAAMLSFAASGLLIGIPETPTPASRRRISAELADGLTFVRSQILLRALMATAVVWNLAWFILQSVYVLYAIERLGLDAAGVGLTLGAFGAGMLSGAAIAPAIMRRMPIGWFIVCGPLGSVAAIAVMVASQAHPGLALPMLSYFLFGCFPILWTIGQTTLRQAITPQAFLGRVSAIFMMASFGARPLGAALGGIVGERFGLGWAIVLAGLGFVVQAVIVLCSSLPKLQALPSVAELPGVRTAAVPADTSR